MRSGGNPGPPDGAVCGSEERHGRTDRFPGSTVGRERSGGLASGSVSDF